MVGATGKMGRTICAAILDDPELELVAAIARSNVGMTIRDLLGRGPDDVRVSDRFEALVEARADVAVDF
ncbi:MAG TPA: 4-hydroxy-tetrahydrodipicolinate reductase, partial [Candidatus Limnocylindria bacterium]